MTFGNGRYDSEYVYFDESDTYWDQFRERELVYQHVLSDEDDWFFDNESADLEAQGDLNGYSWRLGRPSKGNYKETFCHDFEWADEDDPFGDINAMKLICRHPWLCAPRIAHPYRSRAPVSQNSRACVVAFFVERVPSI